MPSADTLSFSATSTILGTITEFLGLKAFTDKMLYHKHFITVWTKPKKINPVKHLGLKYEPYFYDKLPEFTEILTNLEEQRSVLVIGEPLSGKTRSVYELLKQLKQKYAISIVRNVDQDIDPKIPRNFRRKRKELLVINDLQEFTRKAFFDQLLQKAKEENIVILGTCRSAIEWENTESILREKLQNRWKKVFDTKIELGKIDEELAKGIVTEIGMEWENKKQGFSGTIGSLFLDLVEMKRRFTHELSTEARTILQELKKMHVCGIYMELQVFPIAWVKLTCEKNWPTGTQTQWGKMWLAELERWEFISRNKDLILIQECYLEKVILLENEPTDATPPTIRHEYYYELFIQLYETFKNKTQALYNLAITQTNFTLSRRYLRESNVRLSINMLDYLLENYLQDFSESEYFQIQANRAKILPVLAGYGDTKHYLEQTEKAFKAILMHDRTGETYANLGSVYIILGQYKDAEQHLLKAIEFEPQKAETYNNLGIVYQDLQDYERSEKYYKKSLKCDPSYSIAHYNLGNMYRKWNPTLYNKKAIKSYQQAIKHNPEQVNAHEALGDMYQESQNYKEAEKSYKLLLKHNPQHAKTYYDLSIVYGKQNRIKDAIKVLKEAVRIDDNYVDAWIGLGTAFYISKRFLESEKAYKKAIELDPSSKTYIEQFKKEQKKK